MTSHEPARDSASIRARLQLGADLAAARTLAGLPQRDLADRTGISQSKVSRIEAGRKAPDSAELAAWVEATGAQDQAERLIALARIVHNVAADSGPGGARSFLLTDDGALRVHTHHAALTVTADHLITRARELFDWLAGAALSEPSTTVTTIESAPPPSTPTPDTP